MERPAQSGCNELPIQQNGSFHRLQKHNYCSICFANHKRCPANSRDHLREIDRKRALNPNWRKRKNANQAKLRQNSDYQNREKRYRTEYNRKKRESDPDYIERQRLRALKQIEREIQLANERKQRQLIRERNKAYRESKEYKEQQRKKAREKQRQYQPIHIQRMKQRRHTDVAYRLKCRLRAALYQALNGTKKSFRTMEIIGMDAESLLKHLETTLPKGYTMDDLANGRLHIDHKLPLEAFDHADINQVLIAWNWQNLQLLPARVNRRKHAKIIEAQMPLPIPLVRKLS